MSKEKVDKTEVKVYIEIGENLRDVMIEALQGTYQKTSFETEQLVGGLFTSIKDFVTSIIKLKNPEGKIEIKCPTLNKTEDKS